MPMPKDEDKPKKIHGHPAWKFNNPDSKEMMERLGQTSTWCLNDCYQCSMWCPKQRCMNRKDYKKKMEATKSTCRDSKMTVSEDFKVALSVLVFDNKYCILEEQFLKN
eukprot:15367190-Ditylum_brightwellii.AAC.4